MCVCFFFASFCWKIICLKSFTVPENAFKNYANVSSEIQSLIKNIKIDWSFLLHWENFQLTLISHRTNNRCLKDKTNNFQMDFQKRRFLLYMCYLGLLWVQFLNHKKCYRVLTSQFTTNLFQNNFFFNFSNQKKTSGKTSIWSGIGEEGKKTNRCYQSCKLAWPNLCIFRIKLILFLFIFRCSLYWPLNLIILLTKKTWNYTQYMA